MNERDPKEDIYKWAYSPPDPWGRAHDYDRNPDDEQISVMVDLSLLR
jgi:hypothetical protein